MKKKASLLIALIVLLVTQQCKKEDSLNDSTCGSMIPAQEKAVPFTVLEDSVESINCSSKLVEFGPEWKQFISLDPQGSVIWPGAALQFESVKSGAYIPLTGNRKPITISVSLPGIAGIPGRTLQQPSLSSARAAMNDILQQQLQGAATPAQIAWSQTEIYNERHLKLAIGGNYGDLFTDITANFNYNSNSVMGRFLFQFTQVYYSVDCDAPMPGVSNFYHDVPPCSQVGDYSPVYVSSVKYGRKVFLLIESSQYDYTALADIRASFDAFLSSGGLNTNAALQSLMSSSSIKGVIIGGPSFQGVQVVNNPQMLNDYLLAGADFNLSSPGVPLSYTLRFMKDNSVASIVQYDKFRIRECTIVQPSSYSTIVDPSDLSQFRLYRTRGDQEFDGNGPEMTVTVSYEKRNGDRELWQVVKVKMEETKSDWTTGEREIVRKIWTTPNGKKIKSYSHATDSVNTYDIFKYTDIGHGMDYHTFPSSNLIKSITWLGDTGGDDVTSSPTIPSSQFKNWSHVHEIRFNPVKINY